MDIGNAAISVVLGCISLRYVLCYVLCCVVLS